MNPQQLHCSFCAKSAKQIKRLVAGPGDIFICDTCVSQCVEILAEIATKETLAQSRDKVTATPTPRSIKEFLDQFVIGQNDAKEKLAVAVYNHYKRIANPIMDGVEIDKSNLALIGSSGVGKTELVSTVARFLDLPIVCYDTTSLTEAGFVGSDVEDIVARLLQAADGDVQKCERGIIFLDEIDKKRSRDATGSTTRDVGGEGVQQALLKLLEGSDVMVPSGMRRGPNVDLVKVNTRNILFILAGSFTGLDKIIERELDSMGSIGYGAKIERSPRTAADWLRRLQPEHLIKFGFIPELVGRIPVYAILDDLSEDQLVEVLTLPKNALVKQYVKLFFIDGVRLHFDEGALRAMARIAVLRKTNGRALRGVMEDILNHVQFLLPDLHAGGVEQVIIHESTVTAQTAPELIYTKLAAVS
jgi:ATP-dependent Clp protease ATP-binding subunit ClpX